MDDNQTTPEQSPAPAAPPPKLLDQLVAMQTHAGEALAPESPKKRSLLAPAAWLIAGVALGALAFSFLGDSLKKATDTEEAVQAPTPPVETPTVSMKPRVSVATPSDAEVDVAPVPPAGGDLLAELDRKLTAEISTGEGGLKPLIGKAGLALLDSRHGLTDDDLKGQHPDAKALVSTYQDLFRRLGDNLGKNGNVLADVELLAAEKEKLAAGSEDGPELEIAKAVLCQRVHGFGRYETFRNNEFTPGAAPQILVYSEPIHFKARSEENGRFVIQLKQELSIESVADAGQEIWKEREVSVTDITTSRRRDFFIAQYLNLPKTIGPGSYILRIKITDEADSRTADFSIPLTIKTPSLR